MITLWTYSCNHTANDSKSVVVFSSPSRLCASHLDDGFRQIGFSGPDRTTRGLQMVFSAWPSTPLTRTPGKERGMQRENSPATQVREVHRTLWTWMGFSTLPGPRRSLIVGRKSQVSVLEWWIDCGVSHLCCRTVLKSHASFLTRYVGQGSGVQT